MSEKCITREERGDILRVVTDDWFGAVGTGLYVLKYRVSNTTDFGSWRVLSVTIPLRVYPVFPSIHPPHIPLSPSVSFVSVPLNNLTVGPEIRKILILKVPYSPFVCLNVPISFTS